uniref:Uncharacterized protein n=1 Tax=Meloidogyne javanica TaxID=6303 RepID=A0A915MUB2_MELJA
MFANIAALSIVVLQLLGQLNVTVANNVGLGNHILQEGKVKLAADSRVVTSKEEIENMTISANACNVSFDEWGNIYLPYKNQGTAKDKGCTVDLLTDKVDEIVLQSGLYNRVGLGACLRNETINSNVLPFAYSLTNEEVKKFHNGPLFANGSCYSCAEGCVKKTGLEVRWLFDEGHDRGGYVEYAVMNPASNYRLLATPVTSTPTDAPIFNVGLRDHILQNGKVVLANGSMVAKKEDVEQYMSISVDACDVDFNDEGNIVIHYKNQGTAKDRGCTVDLLTDKKDEIVFWTGVQNQGGLDGCMRESDINSNVLPFAYSLTNEEVKKFHNGPLFVKGPCRCNEGCVEKTGLEVRWAYDEDQGKENVGLYANPIGTKLIYYLRKEWNLNKTDVYFDVIINQTVPKFRIKQTTSLPEETPEIPETSKTTSPLTPAPTLKKRTTTIISASTTMTTTTKGSSGLLFYVVIIVVILTVIGIGIAAYFFVINESFDKEENDAEAGVVTKEDVTGEDQKKEDGEEEEEGENKDNVKGEDQMKEYELEQKKEDLKGDNQGKDEGTKDDNKAKEKIQTTTAKTAAPTTESQTKEEQASAEDKNEEEGEEKKVETQGDE